MNLLRKSHFCSFFRLFEAKIFSRNIFRLKQSKNSPENGFLSRGSTKSGRLLERRRGCLYLVIIGFCLGSKTVAALEFQPSVGAGIEYTDNAKLTLDNEVSDLITTAYLGASLAENEGRFIYDAITSIRKQSYTQDSFEDQSYFNLAASANWEMIRDSFNWFVSDSFSQRKIISLGSDTPNNFQDSNVFVFGANIMLPISARQSFTLTPSFSQYYYEQLPTNNKQYSIAASWNYQMFRLTGVGINLSARKINYFERAIADTTFSNLSIVFNGQRVSSNFSISLGATNVKRDTIVEAEADEGYTGYVGSVNWLLDLSSRSTFNTLVSTDITDTSSVSRDSIGNSDDVQISADVVRNSVIHLAYLREDELLRSGISADYRKLTYSGLTPDRTVRSFDVNLNYPVTQLLSGGVYVNFNRTTQLDMSREDKNFTFGSNINYRLTAKLRSTFDIRYRTKESTDSLQNYDEFTVFVSLVYGFGGVPR